MAPLTSIPQPVIARDAFLASEEDTTLNPTLIAGIVVTGVISISAIVWLAIQAYRERRVARKRRDASEFTVTRGTLGNEKPRSLLSSADVGMSLKNPFSRENLTTSVIMPERAVLRPGASRNEIISYYTTERKLPRPFAPLTIPPPPMHPVASTDTPQLDLLPSHVDRSPSGRPSSISSWLFPILPLVVGKHSRRLSAQSMGSSVASFGGGMHKKIRQIFTPVLPDELVVSVGETLMFVQSYDDGWYIVGRDSVFKTGEVELGAVPAWCFMKPVKGLRAERPVRASSLGVTVTLDRSPAEGHRDQIISWSNF